MNETGAKAAAGVQASGFKADLLAGLAARPRHIPCKYLYDQRGSQLFERICELPEYYLTRAELALLDHHGAAIARLCGTGTRLVEFGSGSSRKVRRLLPLLRPAQYVPVDVSHAFLHAEARGLAGDFPWLAVTPVCADFTRPFALPPGPRGGRRVVGFFPGSTIGNFPPDEALAFLRRVRPVLGHDGLMLVGVDTRKDAATLHAAYNDRAGVTAAFTLNLLARANRELGADFDLDGFEHRARYRPGEGRVVIELVSRREQAARVDGVRFRFAAGEAVHVEDSYKYAPDEFQALARAAGYRPLCVWQDPKARFSMHALASASPD